MDRPERTGAGVIDPRPWTACDAFQMRVRVARGDHRLEFGGVFPEIVPQRGKCGSLRRAPHLREPPGQQRGCTKMLFEVGDQLIWGATARILSDLLERLDVIEQSSSD